ncbi:hypothetical protein ACP4OV_020056 [Aristida adscensionis]
MGRPRAAAIPSPAAIERGGVCGSASRCWASSWRRRSVVAFAVPTRRLEVLIAGISLLGLVAEG